MAKPVNHDRPNTTVAMSKHLKLRLRRYAVQDKERKGTESDATIIEKMLSFYEQHHPLIDVVPKSTY